MIIAEAGVNHNGCVDIARKLIDIAIWSGADFIKFQTFTANQCIIPGTEKADYQKINTINTDSQYDMLKALELTRHEHKLLFDYCKGKIGFLSTAFDVESLRFLIDLGVKIIKIASGEIDNLPFLRCVAKFNYPTILSTGMSDLKDVESAIDVLLASGLSKEKLIVLHCTTNYPTQPNQVNLRAMQTISNKFGVKVGYSDHTLGIEIPIAAASLNACVIEKHFTLDRTLLGPDHAASLEPEELKAMVSSIRKIELALGDGVKCPVAIELKNKLIARRSIVAIKNIKAGEIFSENNISTKRPGTGISPMLWDDVIGRTASRDFVANELIKL
jgi:N,N'-diacetyllegionaminate synthase